MMFFKALCILPFLMASGLIVAAMLNDRRDLLRRQREDAEDEAARRPPCRPPALPMSAFEPGSVR